MKFDVRDILREKNLFLCCIHVPSYDNSALPTLKHFHPEYILCFYLVNAQFFYFQTAAFTSVENGRPLFPICVPSFPLKGTEKALQMKKL